ncbi:MAG: hypothetical protein DWQ07_12575 [Chloroflexi bacterium]|nr:MAG: hypothetical protein DWQ07_12575 [Chloroflexota bacterium]MBL1196874.1 hypothetical protein [Chloroflexota bacterium]NOH14170.1 hypothetical protein [Chloroflexota bacterium]
MLDDFLDDGDSTNFLDELEEEGFDESQSSSSAASSSRSRGNFLGMTPRQRAILSLLFFFWACIASTMCLVIFNRISLPF